MRKLEVINHMSLDGVIQSSPEDGFPYVDWGGPYRSAEGRDVMIEAYGVPGAAGVDVGERHRQG